MQKIKRFLSCCCIAAAVGVISSDAPFCAGDIEPLLHDDMFLASDVPDAKAGLGLIVNADLRRGTRSWEIVGSKHNQGIPGYAQAGRNGPYVCVAAGLYELYAAKRQKEGADQRSPRPGCPSFNKALEDKAWGGLRAIIEGAADPVRGGGSTPNLRLTDRHNRLYSARGSYGRLGPFGSAGMPSKGSKESGTLLDINAGFKIVKGQGLTFTTAVFSAAVSRTKASTAVIWTLLAEKSW